MKEVNSFDVFDTLIGRLCYYPKSIFDLVEVKSGFKDFRKYRVMAEHSTPGNYYKVYKRFKELTNASDKVINNLIALEFSLELENVFPIKQNIDRVKDGDILVSDMYLPPKLIHQLLTKVGFNKKVELFVSRRGKATGEIWEKVQRKYIVKLHLGNDEHTDFKMPRVHGIKTEFFKHKVTFLEYLDKDYAGRAMRLSNPPPLPLLEYPPIISEIVEKLVAMNPYEGPKGVIWDEQARLNIPLLICDSISLDGYCKGKFSKVIFCLRDCCHWIKIFKKLFPQYECQELVASRNLLYKVNGNYRAHVGNMYDPNNTVIVDLVGAGNSLISFLFAFDWQVNVINGLCYSYQPDRDWPRVFYKGIRYITPEKEKEKYMLPISTGSLIALEALNYDVHGSVVDFEDFCPIRLPLEYDRDLVQVQHDCVDKAVELINAIDESDWHKELGNRIYDYIAQYSQTVNIIGHTTVHKSEPINSLSYHMSSHLGMKAQESSRGYHENLYTAFYDFILYDLKDKAIDIWVMDGSLGWRNCFRHANIVRKVNKEFNRLRGKKFDVIFNTHPTQESVRRAFDRLKPKGYLFLENLHDLSTDFLVNYNVQYYPSLTHGNNSLALINRQSNIIFSRR